MTLHNRPPVDSPPAAAIRFCNLLTRELKYLRRQIHAKGQTGTQSRKTLLAALLVVAEYRAAIEIQNWKFFSRPTH